MSRVDRYRRVEHELPEVNIRWPLYGAGLENLGRDRECVRFPFPVMGEDQILVRIDAVGLCFSDIKLIRAGAEHPRIEGRDLARNPTVPGHEATMTVVRVGERWRDDFAPGERYLIQADIYYRGEGMAFGYTMPGGLQQYCVLGEEVLEGDDGCYLLPVESDAGYAEVALSEPWACVEAAYRVEYREHLKAGGTAWLVWCEDSAGGLDSGIGKIFNPGGPPERVVVTTPAGRIPATLKRLADRAGFELEARGLPDPEELDGEGRKYDDIVVFGSPEPEFVSSSSGLLLSGGVYALISPVPLSGRVEIDVGRVHYDGLYFTGSKTGPEEAYTATRDFEVTAGGRVWVLGAGGPMGQMHTQRSLELEAGPELVLATDIDSDRLGMVRESFGPLAARSGRRLVTLNPNEMGEGGFEERLDELTAGRGFTEVLVMAPVPAVIEEAEDWLGNNGVLNIFAGIPRGKRARLSLSDVFLSGRRWVGSSGSSISDLQLALGRTQRGELDPNLSVAAIGGMGAVWEGLEAVAEGRLPGKIVIWPQIPDLPLTPLEDLKALLPGVAERLKNGRWTRAAEEALLETTLRI